MTRISRPLRREVTVRERTRIGGTEYVAEMTAGGIRMRRKGTRTWLGPATWGAVLLSCARVGASGAASERDAITAIRRAKGARRTA